MTKSKIFLGSSALILAAFGAFAAKAKAVGQHTVASISTASSSCATYTQPKSGVATVSVTGSAANTVKTQGTITVYLAHDLCRHKLHTIANQ